MSSSETTEFEIRSCRFGKGLFAVKKIPANTVVLKISGREISFANTLSLEEESHALQIDVDKYILCEPPFLFSNHSCNPNCAINVDLEFYTLVDVEKDQELLWDYSTSMYERHWTMQCFCGSEFCRKTIFDFDLLSQLTQKKYVEQKIVLPFILDAMRRRKIRHATVDQLRKSA